MMERSAAELFRFILALGMAVMLILGCFVGCAEEAKPADTAPEATSSPTETSGVATDSTEEPEETMVEYDHYGLHFKLDSSFTAGAAEDDQESFSFDNGLIQGAVEYGPLDQLTGGTAETSKGFAEYLLEDFEDEYSDAWIGSSTGVCYYVVLQNEERALVQGLYVRGQMGWSIWAHSTDPALTDELIRIVGRCGVAADEVPG